MNLNKVFILGNLTRDPESRSTPTGQTVTTFTVATNRFWTDQNNQKQQKTEFHNIVAWGKLGDICAQYLKRGRLVFIEGRLETRSWEGQDGIKRFKTEIIAEGMQLGPRSTQDNGIDNSNNKKESDLIENMDDEVQIEDIPF